MRQGFTVLMLMVVLPLVLTGCNQKVMAPMATKDFVSEVSEKISHNTVAETKAFFDAGNHLFLDCRDKFEFKKGHIPGSMNISRGLMEWKIEKKIPNKEQKIVMYCKSGGRSNLAAHAIQRMGYTNVTHLDGGIDAWIHAGYPVE
jgi:rhodanese-related sulfurtransferase